MAEGHVVVDIFYHACAFSTLDFIINEFYPKTSQTKSISKYWDYSSTGNSKYCNKRDRNSRVVHIFIKYLHLLDIPTNRV